MRTADNTPAMRVQFDTHECKLSRAEIERMQADVDSLALQVANFPISDLHVMVEYNNRSNDYSVKTTLQLPGTALVANDHDVVTHAAYERCLRVLEKNVAAYKDRLGDVPERQKHEKHTHQELLPSLDPDPAALDAAVAAADYTAFRAAAFGYEEEVRKRAGRWVERYPDVDAKIGKEFDVEDIVEGVFLDAFEGYDKRPMDVPLGEWLESLIDPSVRALHAGDADYLENVRLARTARAAV
jgi:ribosome-associated translation inhibitor RaiA